jgi:hypothetical protein
MDAVKINPYNIIAKPISSIDLVLDGLEMHHNPFRIYLLFDKARFLEIYSSESRQEAEKTYEDYLKIMKEGGGSLLYDIPHNKMEFSIK